MILILLLLLKRFFLLSPQLSLSLNQEGLYLQRLKLSFDDPNAVFSTWNDRDDHPCNWYGVTCDSVTGSVNAVDLSSSNLSGPFPLVLCRLHELSSISLYNNSVNSTLPDDIATCQNLQHLDLAQNLFTLDLLHKMKMNNKEFPLLTILLLEMSAIEYGLGNEASKNEDIYSYGLWDSIVKIMTGKSPTDPIFSGGLNLFMQYRLCLTTLSGRCCTKRQHNKRLHNFDIEDWSGMFHGITTRYDELKPSYPSVAINQKHPWRPLRCS